MTAVNLPRFGWYWVERMPDGKIKWFGAFRNREEAERHDMKQRKRCNGVLPPRIKRKLKTMI